MDDKTLNRILGFPYIVSYIFGLIGIAAMFSGNANHIGGILFFWVVILVGYAFLKDDES
ncbi:unnamed protein product [marine sediment metagenome]|uniref:Uncharacterized protein n=1 Tax=marine sediment metagenome TaxID=412755 RepID=X0TAQ6_9ZZZZ